MPSYSERKIILRGFNHLEILTFIHGREPEALKCSDKSPHQDV